MINTSLSVLLLYFIVGSMVRWLEGWAIHPSWGCCGGLVGDTRDVIKEEGKKKGYIQV